MIVLETVVSTMDAARDHMGPAPVWVLARRQTGGRGRRGRAWQSAEGDLHATLALPHPQDQRAAQHSFAAALALSDALPVETRLKWPNDVLAGGAKIAGILLEHTGTHLLIGIGVNILTAPEAPYPTTSLSAHGHRPTPEALLAAIAPRLDHWRARLATDFAPVRAAWLARAAGLGAPITARTPTAEHRGTFDGLAPDGALRLTTAAGALTLPAAELI